nr:MAG TPA: peptidase [Microviridae sp.]
MLIYRMKTDANGKVREHFKVKEFACKDGNNLVLIDEKLADLLENIREHFGKPVYINSGFRTESWNDTIGGQKYSRHLAGEAADIWIKDVKPKEIAIYADSVLGIRGGIICYTNFVHVDVRKSYYRKGV